jgi:hypothetical protein
MPRFKTGVVTALLSEREGLQRVEVDGRPAYVLTQLIGPVAAGDRVVVNTTAVDLGLGSGGWDVVHWCLARDEWSAPGGGHVMKLRYTSLQADTGVAEEADGYTAPGDLGGMPVVALALHSQLQAAAAAFKRAAPTRRLAFVMTDSAALPLALSDLVAELRAGGLLDVTVTAGHAFGGDLEAVNLRSALDVARLHADAALVGPGPGVVGTASPRGFSGLEVAAVVNATAAGGGVPIVALRYSDADRRKRHRGVSHHSLTSLHSAHGAAIVAIPRGEPHPEVDGHTVLEVDVVEVDGAPSMGRAPADDPKFHLYAAAAGAAAAR